MYQTESTSVPVRWTERGFWKSAWQSVTPNVWYLGMTSLLTDISSEMVVSVLPAYLVLQLGLSPLAFGALDGLYNGVTAVTRWASGVAADRWRRHKEIAAAGYALSAISRLGLLAAGRAWSGLALAIGSERLGKGIRTVPRDALISLSSPPARLAHSFGVHRALDAAGALLGPIVAFTVLGLAPDAFDVVFVTSFSIAVVGLGVLLLFVENIPATSDPSARPAEPSLRTAIGLLRAPDFRVVVITASALALLTISDAFIYLALQDRLQFAAGLFPLLYVGTAFSYMSLAVPAGLLADRFGRPRTFLIGHCALLLLYGLLLAPSAPAMIVVLSVVLLGGYYAATDGVIVALASGMLPETLRGTGLAVLTTATSLSRLVASLVVGWLWTVYGREIAIVVFGIALAVSVICAAIPLSRTTRNAHG